MNSRCCRRKPAKGCAGINLALIMSHLACADDAALADEPEQLDRFRAALAALPPAPASLRLIRRHPARDRTTPSISCGPASRSMAEIPGPASQIPSKLSRADRAASSSVRRVDKGETVGYGATFRVGRPTTLATVALGYADGLMRAIGNRGAGAIGGDRERPIAGRVSMDLVTLDVTDVPGGLVRPGAEVEFLGDTISSRMSPPPPAPQPTRFSPRSARACPRPMRGAP